MKKSVLQLLSVAAIVIFMTARTTTGFAYPGGSPAGYTGSPGDTHSCTSCHNGSSSTVSGWITSTIPANGYTAGTTYTLTVTVTGTTSNRKGFEVSPQNASGTQPGTLLAGTSNPLTGGTKYVPQSRGS
jgi:hypothetical protein